MKRRAFLSLLDGATAVPSSAPYAHSIDARLRKAVEDKAIPGVVAMATDREGAFYRGAFGLADARRRAP